MLKVGITGNIGAGKTMICRVFSLLDIPVFDADNVSKNLLSQEVIAQKVKALLGAESYLPNGMPDRKYIAVHVFDYKEKLKALEAIIHPAVKQCFKDWAKKQSAPYILKEAALLIESGSYVELDKVIVVSAPETLRIERARKRDNAPLNKIEKRIQNQWPEIEKLKKADFIIYNDGVHPVIPQIAAIHQTLLREAKKVLC